MLLLNHLSIQRGWIKRYVLTDTLSILDVVAQANILVEKEEDRLALPLTSDLNAEVDDDEAVYAKLMAEGEKVSRAVPMANVRAKQHVERKAPPPQAMVIQIETEDEDQDVIIDVDNPFSNVGVEIVQKTGSGSVSSKRYAFKRHAHCWLS